LQPRGCQHYQQLSTFFRDAISATLPEEPCAKWNISPFAPGNAPQK